MNGFNSDCFKDKKIQNLILDDINRDLKIELNTKKDVSLKEDMCWGKSLEFLPVFTRREIDNHMNKCGKLKGKTIKKTLERGLKFKQERYISTDSLFTTRTLKHFIAKCTCRASMKKMIRKMQIYINRKNSQVDKASCSCPAGLSGYCNHIMALLLELADYSLNSFKVVPSEIACTSTLRKWGVPGEKQKKIYPVMKNVLHANFTKKGINPTVYEARRNFNFIDNLNAVMKLQNNLKKINPNIGYAHIIPNKILIDSEITKFGMQCLGSPLSYQLLPVERNFIVLSHLCQNVECESIITSNLTLPSKFLDIPDTWNYSPKEMEFMKKIIVSQEESISLQKKTVKQRQCAQWFKERKYRITSSNAHKIYIRKSNFEFLIKQLTEDIKKSNNVKEMLNHGNINEDIAKEKFKNVMIYRLNQNIKILETGLLVQPCIPWLGASPDGLVLIDSKPCLIEIKCPYTKRNENPNDLVKEETFYIGSLPTGELFLKKDHLFGYYTQVQMAMGLSGLTHCLFIVYVYKGIIIVNVDFDEFYFLDVIDKLSDFYKKYILSFYVSQ